MVTKRLQTDLLGEFKATVLTDNSVSGQWHNCYNEYLVLVLMYVSYISLPTPCPEQNSSSSDFPQLGNEIFLLAFLSSLWPPRHWRTTGSHTTPIQHDRLTALTYLRRDIDSSDKSTSLVFISSAGVLWKDTSVTDWNPCGEHRQLKQSQGSHEVHVYLYNTRLPWHFRQNSS